LNSLDPLNFSESGWWGTVFSVNEATESNFDRFWLYTAAVACWDIE
jgi:hypothetical protein